MTNFEIVIGADLRCYHRAEIEAETPEAAKDAVVAMLQSEGDLAAMWTWEKDSVQGDIWVQVNDDDESHGFDLPDWNGVARYSVQADKAAKFDALMAAMNGMAAMPLTVYGLATGVDGGVHCDLFTSQTARADFTSKLNYSTAEVEAEITIDLATVPAVAALIQRNAELEAFRAKVAQEMTIAEDMMDDTASAEDYYGWAEENSLIDDLRRLDGYVKDARALASPDATPPAPTIAAALVMIRDLRAQMNNCVEQMQQMQGMFNDEDGQIQQAIDDAEEMDAKATAFVSAATEAAIGGAV